MSDKRSIFGRPTSRRRVLQLLAGSAGLALTAACGAAPAAPTNTPAAAKPAAEPPKVTLPTPGGAPAAAPTNTPVPAAAAPAAKPTEVAKPAAAPAAAGGKAFNGAWPYEMPPAGHFNTYIPKNTNLGIYQDLIEQPLGMYYWATAKWMPLLATEWKMLPPDKFEVTLRQGVKWSDGNEFSAKDLIATFNVGRLENWTIWRYIDNIEAAGNKVTFHMKQPSTVVVRYIIRERMRDAATYGQWGDKVADLVKQGKDSNSEEWKKVRADFQLFRPKEMIASGPFKIDPASMTEAQLTLVKVPTAWNASQVGFDKVVLYNGETPTVTPVVLAKQVDYATHGFPPATEKAFLDAGIRVLRPPTYGGAALKFNYDKVKAVGPKEVRQAIAHAFKRDDAAAVALGRSANPPKYMAGFSDNLVPLWMSEADIKKLNPYEYNPQKAEGILKEVGYTKGSDGIWVSKDGEKMDYEVSVPAEYADSSAVAINVAEQLSRFGIKTTVRTVTFTQHPIEVNEGKFQFTIRGWGAADPHPHFSFDAALFVDNIKVPPGMKFPLKQKTSTGEIDLEKVVLDSADGLDENAQKALVAKAALAFNELLPIIPVYERYGNNPTAEGARIKGWPPDGDPIYTNSPYTDAFTIMLMYEGKLQPV
ncbi:MAG TPA: ABC transporter substrate-binding protein [Chloroflexota bacterium]|nr:ABC transporter substrate-binding protein [Chloroflexota bacterium]